MFQPYYIKLWSNEIYGLPLFRQTNQRVKISLSYGHISIWGGNGGVMEKGSGGIVEWGSVWGAACVAAEFPTVCTLYKFNIWLPGLLYVLRRIKRNPPKLDFPEKHTPASQSPQCIKTPAFWESLMTPRSQQPCLENSVKAFKGTVSPKLIMIGIQLIKAYI